MKKLSFLSLLTVSLIISSNTFAYWPPSQEEINKMMQQQWAPSNMPWWWPWVDAWEMQRQWEAQWLAQLKKSISSFTNSINTTKTQIAKFEKQWWVQSQTLKNAMVKAKTIVDWINNATSIAQAQEFIDMIDSVTSTWWAEMERLAMTAQLPNLFKRAENELNKLQTQFDRIKNNKKVWEFDATQTIEGVQTKILELQASLWDIKSNYKTNPATALEDIQIQFFDKLQDTWQLYWWLQALQNMQSATVSIVKTAKLCDKVIEKAKASNIDTTELSAINSKIKTKIEEFIAMIKTTLDVNKVEEVTAKIWEIMALKDDFDTAASGLNIPNNTVNPLDSYIPTNAFSKDSFGDISKKALEWNISPMWEQPVFSEVSDSMTNKIIKAVAGLEISLNNKFWSNNEAKIKYLDWINEKIQLILWKASVSDKNKAIYNLLWVKLTELKTSYIANFNSSYDDILSSDLKDLLEVK